MLAALIALIALLVVPSTRARIVAFFMPYVVGFRFSVPRRMKAQLQSDRKLKQSHAGLVVHYFHQLDDPYSALAVQILLAFYEKYRHSGVRLDLHVVSAPSDAYAPEREKLIAYSRRDSALLANHFYDLSLAHCFQTQPSEQAIQAALVLLAPIFSHVDPSSPVPCVESLRKITRTLWENPSDLILQSSRFAEPQQLQSLSAMKAHVCTSNALREQWGHYLGGMLYFNGEWYWGLDRLHFLEMRLQDLFREQPNSWAEHSRRTHRLLPEYNFITRPWVIPQIIPQVIPQTPRCAPPHTRSIDFYFSFRSPYSAITVRQIFALAKLYSATVNLRFVLPMVMRGLPVPSAKRIYIVEDVAREAHFQGDSFGFFSDPVGPPTERGLALVPLAVRLGRGPEYVTSFMAGVWGEGVDAGTDRGLRKIAERAGLPWAQCVRALGDPAWRAEAESNRAAMYALGLWGVPSFRVGGLAVWGHDRLWAVEDALRAA
jgi:2-hydroxychromene-2-carboxylate isomerase